MRRLERYRRLVIGGRATGVDDDPAVGERDDRWLPFAQHLAEHAGVEALGTGPSLALQHRADLNGPAEPGNRDPCREHGRRVEARRVEDVVAVQLASRLDGGAPW